MSDSSHLKTIAIIGSTGNLGKFTLRHLAAAKKSNIIAITRPGSEDKVLKDPSVTTRVGDYNDHSFLVSAMKGAEALVIIVGVQGLASQKAFINAAAEAGVTYIFPAEYGSDFNNPILAKAAPEFSGKRVVRDYVEELSKKHSGLAWIGLVTNPWVDYIIPYGAFSIDHKNRTATLYDGGKTKFNTTILATAGLALARILLLPKSTLESRKNKFFYASSFRTSQLEILESFQRVTKTTSADWTINHESVDAYLDDGHQRMKNGDMGGLMNIVVGTVCKEGLGGDYESEIGTDVDLLGLPTSEDLDDVIKKVLSVEPLEDTIDAYFSTKS